MALKDVCFMVMPFGVKPTHTTDPNLPGQIDFDALWDRALRPMLEELDFEPIRADQDIGSLIVQEMIERLAYSELVIAEMTLSNANVYYEVGLRQAAKQRGCVLIAADWSKAAFDVDQMRRLPYPLPEGTITDETVKVIRGALVDKIKELADGVSPVFQALPGYPTSIDFEKSEAFKSRAKALAELQAEILTARRVESSERKEYAIKMAEKHKEVAARLPSVTLDILNLLKDATRWQEILQLVNSLPERIGDLPIVQETYALALSKAGQPHKSIEVLEVLIQQNGDTSERRGLLGGRYKRLYDEAKNEVDRYKYLNSAIEDYEQGMLLDLNDYYPSSNLPRLYRLRGDDGDEEKARKTAVIALAACHRARGKNPHDQWVNPTLLAAAFDAGDISEAKRLYKEIRRAGQNGG